MANFTKIHGRSSFPPLGNSRRRLEDVVKERCQSKNFGMKEALDLFRQMLEEMPKPHVSSFNVLLTLISRMKNTHHHLSTMVSLYNKMNWVGGISPDDCTFGIFINSFSHMNRVDLGFAVFGSLLKRDLSGNTIIFNSFMNGLCQQNKVGEAAQLLDRMPQLGFTPDVFSYNTLIKGLCNAGNVSLSLELLQKMSLTTQSSMPYRKEECWTALSSYLKKWLMQELLRMLSPTILLSKDYVILGMRAQPLNYFRRCRKMALVASLTWSLTTQSLMPFRKEEL